MAAPVILGSVAVQRAAWCLCRAKNVLNCKPSAMKVPAVNACSTLAKVQPASETPIQSNELPAVIDPLKHPDFFQVHQLFTIKDLFNSGVHFGHKEGSFNQHMRPFIFGSRLGHLVFDLNQTTNLLRQALNFAAHIAYQNGIVLFVTRNRQTMLLVERTAEECQQFAHTRDWLNGTFTNVKMHYGGVTRLPDLMIFLHTLGTSFEQHRAVADAAKMLIPSIGIVDTNCDPRLVTYPVPGNDDSPSAIKLYCNLFKEAINRGKRKRKEVDSINNVS